MASEKNGTLYVGVTSDLLKRIYEHRNSHVLDAFSARYRCKMLVYYELIEDMETAITREKQIKAGSRAKKLALIEDLNPGWDDLWNTLTP